ncbi:MAG: hydrogenase, partial [Planctomycetes bacterium]|nr:hydrogenase [Planctomycetota bacterium]
NHAVFKGLLFLGAGAVAHGTGTREMDHLGGLAKRMPVTGGAFLVGAAAISGLPPLNGFVSEFLILLGGFQGVVTTGPGAAVPALAAVTGLALIGGLAAACFAKAFGIVFLGEPRSDHAAHAHDVGLRMKVSMVVLSAMCLGIGLVGPWAVDATSPVVERMAGGAMVRPLAGPILWKVTAVSTGLLALILALVALRSRLLARRTVGETVTWDCGYAAPTARMQYTSSSFAQPLTSLFAPFLRPRTHAVAPAGHFPRDAEFASEVADVCRERIFRPSFQFVAAALHRLRWLQHGRVHLYVLYIAVTLLVLLVWKLS